MSEFLVSQTNGKATARFVFAHGAGAPMDHVFMNTVAESIAGNGVEVVRFEFSYMAKRRVDGKRRGPGNAIRLLGEWRDVIEKVGADLPLYIGGKSMGGRLASMVADEYEDVIGLICLGYPFHPPGKPEKLRTEHLADLKTRTLILQGERDTFGTSEEVAGYELSEAIQVEFLPDGDHGLKPRKKSGFTEEGNLAKAVQLATAFMK